MSNHLKDINMSYTEHFRCALGYASKMILGGIALTIHAIFPNIFINTGSQIIKDIHKSLEDRNENS